MSDVRKMTNAEIIDRLGVAAGLLNVHYPVGANELVGVANELARRIGIVEELCEACEVVPKEELNDVPDSRWARWWSAFLTYRAMKEERDA